METDTDLKLSSLFRNICNARRFAIDIGGSLAKLAYSSRQSPTRATAMNQVLLRLYQYSVQSCRRVPVSTMCTCTL